MTPKLRNRHRAIWIVYLVVLPILFVLAYCNRPTPEIQDTRLEAPQTQLNSSSTSLYPDHS